MLRRIVEMAPIGYIVQYSNEDDYTVYRGFVKLHRNFTEALEHATALYSEFLQSNHYQDGQIFNTYAPTKKTCDTHGSSVVFESAAYIVWIDCVLE